MCSQIAAQTLCTVGACLTGMVTWLALFMASIIIGSCLALTKVAIDESSHGWVARQAVQIVVAGATRIMAGLALRVRPIVKIS